MTQGEVRAVPVLSTPTMSIKMKNGQGNGDRVSPVDQPPPVYSSQFLQQGYPSTPKSLNGQGLSSPGFPSGRTSRAHLISPPPPQNRFMSSVYWLVNNHRKFAIRQILLVLAFGLFTLLGGMIFYFSEKHHEKVMLRGQVEALNALLQNITNQFETLWEQEGNEEEIQRFLRDSYKEMLQNEGRYGLSALWKYDDGNYAWQYWPSVFYVTNIFMGVDYGSVPNQNGVGRLTLALYACIMLALAQVVVRDLGHWYLFMATWIYARINTFFRKLFGLKPLEEIELPIWVPFALLLASWCFVAAFICGYDHAFGPDGINYWLSFYLAYETVTTIGIGDVMPTYAYKAPLWKFFCFFFGTPFRSVNHGPFVVFERIVFYPLTKLGDLITRFTTKRIAPETLAQLPYPEDDLDQGFQDFITDRRDLYGGQYGRVRINANQVDDTEVDMERQNNPSNNRLDS